MPGWGPGRLVAGLRSIVRRAFDRGPTEWRLERVGTERTVWRRGEEQVECFRLGDGYVVTASRAGRPNRWQLTPGHAALPSALAVVTLYLEHGLAPQIDRDGRPFVGVADNEPTQVFAPSAADADTRYVYLDAVSSFDGFPPFLPVRDDVLRVDDRMPSPRPPVSGAGE